MPAPNPSQAVKLTSFRSQFEADWLQRGSLLKYGAMYLPIVGDSMWLPEFETSKPNTTVTIGAETPNNYVDYNSRFTQPVPYDWGHLFDEITLARVAHMPIGSIERSAVDRCRMEIDERIVSRMVGPVLRKTGIVDGEITTVNFPDSQKIAYNVDNDFGNAGATGLTSAKLQEAKSKLETVYADDQSRIFCAASANLLNILMRDEKIGNYDWNSEKPLANGRIKNWNGINFIKSQLLGRTAADDAVNPDKERVLVWAQSAVYYTTNFPLRISNSIRHDRSDSYQVYIRGMCDLVRMKEVGVVEIGCGANPV